MNKRITTILLCIGLLFLTSGAVQAYEHKLEPEIRYQAHIQDIGWGPNVLPGCVSGTTGQNLRLEGIKIEVFSPYDYDLNLEYETHIQDIGWESEAGLGLKTNNQVSGTEGMSLRLEGIKIKLTGADADKFDIVYRTHIENRGWEMKWARNGEMSGTEGESLKLEAIVIGIVPKGTEVITDTPRMYEDVNDKCNQPKVTNLNYIPWKVNFDNSNCEHQWENYILPKLVNEVQVFKPIAYHYDINTKKNVNLTKLYETDVANGCIYNYVEWQQGHGNTNYPEGINENTHTYYNLLEDRYATREEVIEAFNAQDIRFYYCSKCGKTSLGGHYDYYNYNY